MKIAVTGAGGLLGWHCAARIHAANCGARFKGELEPFELVLINREAFMNESLLVASLQDVDAIVHFAGVNRGSDTEVEEANPRIARTLVKASAEAELEPFVVYANSIHSALNTPYGRSKKLAGQILEAAFPTRNLLLPHVFGECARPEYNNVTATFINRIWQDEPVSIDPEGTVELVHAGAVADFAINAAVTKEPGTDRLHGRRLSVRDLYEMLTGFHKLYASNIFPDLEDPFALSLFNSYRTAAFPNHYPIPLQCNTDERGMLFESAKGGVNPQTFISTTKPGKTRGDHFHINLVERFLVVKGKAIIRIRRVLSDDIHEFRVTGDQPVAIDQLPLHTHNIENVGAEDLVTFFWSHKIFDASNPDTFADPV